jgi:hypothetical protein
LLPAQNGQRRGWFSRTFWRQVSGMSNTSSARSDRDKGKEQERDNAGNTIHTDHETTNTNKVKINGNGNGRKPPHRRCLSDLALHIVHPTTTKKGDLKDADLQSLVRLCGKSMLYLPSEYAPCSLVLPTCFRATAQYLVQHGEFFERK